MDVTAECVDAVPADHHDGRIVLLKILGYFADRTIVPVIKFLGIVDVDFPELLETEKIFGNDDTVVQGKCGCERRHREGDEFGIRNLTVNSVMNRRVDTGVFPTVVLVIKKIDQVFLTDRVEDCVFGVDREEIRIEFRRQRAVINAEKIFPEHGKGECFELTFGVLFVHKKDFII